MNDNNPVQPEEFDQLLRSKLNDHQVVPPRESWDAIAAGLSAGTSQKLIPVTSSRNVRMYWISGVTAASVVLLFGLFTLTDLFTSGVSVSSDQFSSVVSESSQKDKNVLSEDKNLISKGIQVSDNQSDKFSSHLSGEEKATMFKNEDFTYNNEKLSQSDLIETNNVNDSNNLISLGSNNNDDEMSEAISKSDDKTADQLKDNQLKLNNLSNDDDLIADWDDPIKKNVGNDWTISAGLGLNGGLPDVGAMDYFDLVMSDKFATSSELYSYVPAPNEFRTRTHHLPLSFGLLFSKKIDKGLYLESGLVYTFLHTSFTDMGWGDWKADQKLHYLGLPVSLKVDLWSRNKWSVYLSGGMMFEKGLWSVYEQHQYWNNADQLVMIEKQIEGWQFSLNGSTGFAYKIAKQTDLYAEPQISYFFDQAQPLSVRTEMPLSIGVKAGLRFGLK